MTDPRRTVSIDIVAIDKISSTLDKIADKFQSISTGFNVFSTSIDSVVTKLSGLKIPDSMESSVKSIKSLDGIKLPDIGKFASGMTKLATIGEIRDLSPIVTELSKLSKIKVPAVLQLANGLEKLSGSTINIGVAASAIKGIIAPLERLAKIAVPNISRLADGIGTLSNSVISSATSQSIVQFVNALRTLDGIKVPDMKRLSSGIIAITEIKDLSQVTTNLQSLINALGMFKGVKIPAIYQLATGFKQLQSMDVVKITQNIQELAKAISILEKSGTLKNFSTLANDLRTLQTQLASVIPQMQQIQTGFTKVGRSAEQAGGKVKGFGERLTNYIQYRVIADTVMKMQDAFFGALNVIKEYDQSLKDLQAITGATGAEVSIMGDKIIEVAKNTKFSAGEVASGMVILGQAGLSASEAVNTIGSVSDLATGTLSDMATTVDLVSTALNVFGISANRSAMVADVFANAVNKSKLTMDKLKTAFNYVGPIAKDAGISFKETAASMMVLANAGQRASTIGTGLRLLFSNLIDPPKKLAIAVEKAGLTLEDLDPRARGLQTVLKNLDLVVTDSGMAFDIFGKRGAAAALALKDGIGGFQGMMSTVGQTGTASKMAAIQVEGLSVIFKNLMDRVRVLAISLGNAGISDILRGIGKGAQSAVEALDYFVNSSVGGFITSAVVYTASATSMIVVMGKLVTGINAVTAAYSLNLAASASLIGSGTLISASAVSVAGAIRAIPMAVGAALTAMEAFAVTGGFLATTISAFIVPIVLGIGYFIHMARSIDDFRESSEKAIKEVSKFETLQGGVSAYSEKVRGLADDSDELKDANIALRSELIKVAESNDRVAISATAAANAIDPYTGKILDNGEALKKYNDELEKVKFDELSTSFTDSMKDVGNQTDGLNRVLNKAKDSLYTVGTAFKTTLRAVLNSSTGEFGSTLKENDVYVENFSKEMKKSLEFSKELRTGKASFSDFAKYVSELNSFGFKNLSEQGKDLVVTFDNISDRSSAMINYLIKANKITLDGPSSQLVELSKNSKMTAEDLQALVYKFDLLKEAKDKAAQSNKLEFVTEFSGGATGKVMKNLETFIEEYKKVHGEVSAEVVGDIEGIIKKNQDLANQYSKIAQDYNANVSKMGEAGASEQRYVDEQAYMAKVRELLYADEKNFSYSSARKIAIAKEALDKQLKLNIDNGLEGRSLGEEDAKAKIEYAKKVQDALLSVYDPKILKEQLQTNTRVLAEETEKQLLNVSLREAKETITKEQAEKERFQITLKRYNDEYNATLEFQNKVSAASASTDQQKQDAIQATLKAEEQRTAFVRKELVDATAAEKKASDKIIDYSSKITEEKDKNYKETVKDKAKYDRDILSAEHTLSNKITNINVSLNTKLNDLAKKRSDNEEKAREDIVGIYQSAEDKIRGIKQRGMSDSKKEADNLKTYRSQLEQGTKLIDQASQTGNKSLLDRGKSMVESALDIGSSLENEKKAINAVNDASDQLAKARRAEANIVNKEIKAEENQEISLARTKYRLAKEDAAFKISKINEIFAQTNSSEVDRHAKEMKNLDDELNKWKEKASIAQSIINSSVGAAQIGVNAPLDKPDTSKQTPIKASTILAENSKIQQSIKQTSIEYQNSITNANANLDKSVQNVKGAIGEVSRETSDEINTIMKDGYQKVILDGKEVFTNSTKEQLQSLKEIGEAMISTGKTVNATFSVANVDTGGITKAKNDVTGLMKISGEGVTLNISTDDLKNKVDSAKSEIRDISTLQQIVPVEVKSITGKSIKEAIDDTKSNIDEVSKTNPEVNVTVSKEEFDILYDKLRSFDSPVNITIIATVENLDQLDSLVSVVSELNKTDSRPKVTCEVVGNELLALMGSLIDKIINKFVSVIVATGNSVTELQSVLRGIQDIVAYDGKKINITVDKHYQNSGVAAEGFAVGGPITSAFKRMQDRFITTGSGHKDDVPILAKKGEFVHTDKAVNHYGLGFMRDLNALRIPKNFLSRFNLGGLVGSLDGFVQRFAKGGHVGFAGTMSNMKKKLEEELNTRRVEISSTMGINLNGSMRKASTGQTDSSISSMKQLQNAVRSSISNFVIGGSTNDGSSVSDISKKLQEEYAAKIRSANSTGDLTLAGILKKEQSDLKSLSSDLVSQLKSLEGDYIKFKNDAVRSHKEKVSEIRTTYLLDSTRLKDSHKKTLEELKQTYLDKVSSIDESKDNSEKEYQKAIEDYKTEKEALIQEKEETEKSNKIKYYDLIRQGHDLGVTISGIVGRNDVRKLQIERTKADNSRSKRGSTIGGGTVNAGAITFDEYERLNKKRVGPYKPTNGEPDFDFIRGMLKGIFPDLESDTYINPIDDNKARTEISRSEAAELFQSISSIEKDIKESEPSKISKEFNDKLSAITEKEKNTRESYINQGKDLKDEKVNNKNEYESSVSDENASYLSQSDSYDKDLVDKLKAEDEDYQKMLDSKSTDNSNKTANLMEGFEKYQQTIKEHTAKMLDDGASGNINTSSIMNNFQKLSNPIEELLKKLGVPIKNFNVGGFVSPTAYSTPGKDSILASLTPQEYVIPDKVVEFFGRGFFDDLIHYRVKGFNLGGAVGNIPENSFTNVSQLVKHSLDLTINGSSHGELYGDKSTIDSLLNDIYLAQMRS